MNGVHRGFGGILRRLIAPAALLLAVSAAADQASQHTGWEQGVYDGVAGCPPESGQGIARAVRLGVDREARRGEHSFRPPEPVGQLSCMSQLLDVPAPNFSLDLTGLGDWSALFGAVLGNMMQPGLAGTGGFRRTFCDTATAAFGRFTDPLGNIFASALPLPGSDLVFGSAAGSGQRIDPAIGTALSIAWREMLQGN